MANFKRGKCKRQVKCTLCTPHKYLGNHKGRFKAKEEISRKAHMLLKRLFLDNYVYEPWD
jgi:hypothetical protein